MRFIDFQIARVVPPVADLSYVLCFSATKDVVDNMEMYLEIYYKSLCEFLKVLGSDPDLLYPHKVFMQQWEEFGKFGPALLLFALRLILSEEHEAPSLVSREEYARTLVVDEMVNQAEHDRRIVDVFKKFVSSGWL